MSAAIAEIDDLLSGLVAIRHDLHRHPELGRTEVRTAARIAEELRAIGLAAVTGIGGHGVVAEISAGTSGRRIGLRADMDALPIQEASGVAYASATGGIAHSCGHDGHMTMLLGAARHLARTRRFDGTVVLIFQPAEEGLAGARDMIADGLFERFPVDEVYAVHNWPDLPEGEAATRPGPIMAAADRFDITVTGSGGHAAMPHTTPDAILAASDLVTQLHAIVSRRIAPAKSAVLSVAQIAGGNSYNVLPASVALKGTIRTFEPAVQDRIEAAVRGVAAGVALASETAIDIAYERYYPATVNDPAAAVHALAAAARVTTRAGMAEEPSFGAEDFSFMLQQRPGAYLWLGQGRHGKAAALHHPAYDFNDGIIGRGVAFYTALVESRLTAQA